MDESSEDLDPEGLRRALLDSSVQRASSPGRLARLLAWVGVVCLVLAALLVSLLPSRSSHQQELLESSDVGPSPAIRVPARPPGSGSKR